MLNLIDEHTRECLLIRAERRWSSARVIEALADVMVMKGIPEHLRSDNGPEFVAKELRKGLAERWRVHYNTVRPNSSLGYRPPAPAAWLTANNKGCGEVEIATRFPLSHTPDGG